MPLLEKIAVIFAAPIVVLVWLLLYRWSPDPP